MGSLGGDAHHVLPSVPSRGGGSPALIFRHGQSPIPAPGALGGLGTVIPEVELGRTGPSSTEATLRGWDEAQHRDLDPGQALSENISMPGAFFPGLPFLGSRRDGRLARLARWHGWLNPVSAAAPLGKARAGGPCCPPGAFRRSGRGSEPFPAEPLAPADAVSTFPPPLPSKYAPVGTGGPVAIGGAGGNPGAPAEGSRGSRAPRPAAPQPLPAVGLITNPFPVLLSSRARINGARTSQVPPAPPGRALTLSPGRDPAWDEVTSPAGSVHPGAGAGWVREWVSPTPWGQRLRPIPARCGHSQGSGVGRGSGGVWGCLCALLGAS